MTTTATLTATPLLYTPEEAAAQVRMGRGRFYELIKSGEIPSVKIGHRRRIRAADLEKWVAELPADDPATSPA